MGIAGKKEIQCLLIIRVVRIFRLFRFARVSGLMQTILNAIRNSAEALLLLLFFLLLAMTIFSSLMWFVERGDWDAQQTCFVRAAYGEKVCSPFQSVPQAFYWAVTTMTTVGYGDVTGLSVVGRATSAITMVFGVLVLAMPVSVLGAEFLEGYSQAKEQKLDRSPSKMLAQSELDDGHESADTFQKARLDFLQARSEVFDVMDRIKQEVHDVLLRIQFERMPGGFPTLSKQSLLAERLCHSAEFNSRHFLTEVGVILDELAALDEEL